MSDRLHVQVTERVATVTLNDPKRRNALDIALCDDISSAFDDLEARDDVGAAVVTGTPPAFCAGADLSQLASPSPEALQAIYEGFLRVGRSPLPTVAAVNGPAVGAGLNLALVCDVRVASPNARFDCRFARIGLHPGGGHTRLLTEAVGPQAAAAMVLAGESPDGERGAAIGLAWTCVDAADLLDEATRIAGRAADLPRELARRVKASLRETPRQASLEDAVALELERQRWSLEQGFFAEQRAKTEAR